MNKAIDADYYGFRDEEDGVLDKVERVVRVLNRLSKSLKWWGHGFRHPIHQADPC